MNAGEIWRFENGARRLVLSPAAYNKGRQGRAISVSVVGAPPEDFDPFGLETAHGTVLVDTVTTHPRHWLVAPTARIDDDAYAQVREHLTFLLGLG